MGSAQSVQRQPLAGLVSDATDETFEDEVLLSPVPVLVDFWAPWCRPCRILVPALEWIASSFMDRVKVVQVNTDLNRELAERYNIRGLPTVMVFAKGQVQRSAMGVRPPEEYVRYLEDALTL